MDTNLCKHFKRDNLFAFLENNLQNCSMKICHVTMTMIDSFYTSAKVRRSYNESALIILLILFF